MPGKPQSLEILIQGALSPTVLASLNKAEKMLRDFGVSAKTQSEAMKRVYNSAFSGLAPSLEKATIQANSLHDAFGRIGEIAGGVAIGDLLVSGLERGVQLVESMAEGIKEMAIHSSELASHFEMQSRGIGNLLRNQTMANQLMGQLQTVANASPFQLTELADTAKQLAARGIAPGDLLQRTSQIGDIVAGLGGGAGEMERATLAYGEAMSGKTLNTREINQLTELGVPVWAELQKFTGKSVEEIHKLIEKHMIDSRVLDKIFDDMTTGEGLFANAMKNFSETFQGELTTFQDKTAQAERDFGFIVNDWVGDILKFVNSSGGWDEVHAWMLKLREMSQAILNVAHSLPTGEMGAVFAKFQGMFADFNKLIGSFFTEVEIPNQGNVVVLNALGDEKICEAFQTMSNLLKDFTDFVESPNVKNLASWTANEGILIPFENLFHNLGFLVKLWADVSAWDLPALGKDIKDQNEWFDATQRAHREEREAREGPLNWLHDQQAQEQARHVNEVYEEQVNKARSYLDALDKQALGTSGATDSLQTFTVKANAAADALAAIARNGPDSRGSNYGLHGGFSDSPGHNQTYFEYDDEGHSSQFGPGGNRLGDSYGIGLSDYNLKQHPLGSWVKVRTPNGKVIWRQVNERASRDIEFHTSHGHESDYGEGKSEIIDSSPTKPVTINYAPTFHLVGESDHIRKILREHAEELADHVRRVFADGFARSAVV